MRQSFRILVFLLFLTATVFAEPIVPLPQRLLQSRDLIPNEIAHNSCPTLFARMNGIRTLGMEVSSITRWDPSRKLASSDPNEKPPQFCIGNSCTPAMSAEEFFSESPVSKYCEIPK